MARQEDFQAEGCAAMGRPQAGDLDAAGDKSTMNQVRASTIAQSCDDRLVVVF